MNRPLAITAGLTLTYSGLAVLGTFWGPAPIAPAHVVRTIAAAVGLDDPESVPAPERIVVLRLRLPRVLLLGLVGAALACSGAALQATFENPLADPGVLGVTAGAALGAVLAIHTGLTEWLPLSLTVAAFLGAACAASMVYGLAYLGGRPTVPGLLLTGVAVGSMASAGVSLVVLITAPYRPDGPAAVQGSDGDGHTEAGTVRGAGAAAAVERAGTTRPGDGLPEVPAEGGTQALRQCGRFGR